MLESVDQQTTQHRLEILRTALHSGSAEQIRHLLASLHPAEAADLLESLPHGPREILWELVDAEIKGEILTEVNEEVRAGLIEGMEKRVLFDTGAEGTILLENMQKLGITPIRIIGSGMATDSSTAAAIRAARSLVCCVSF